METVEFEIYTDGACKANGTANAVGGWAYMIISIVDNEPNLIYQDSDHVGQTTNQRMELGAAINALEKFKNNIENEVDNFHCTIYSDSAYLVRCYNEKWYEKWMRNGWKNTKGDPVLNVDLWEKLIPYFCDPQFVFKKVAAHTGAADRHSEFNDKTDKLAQFAAQNFMKGSE